MPEAPPASFETVGNRITLIREVPARFPFGKPSREVLPLAHWAEERPVAARAATARIFQAIEDGERTDDGAPLVVADGDGVDLHPAFVARLSDGEAEALGLPPATKLALNLKSFGVIHKDGFRIDRAWTRPGGAYVRTFEKPGGRLGHDGREWRIPEPLYTAMAKVAAVNEAPDEPTRQAAFAELKCLLGTDAAARITTDGTIDQLRLSYASGFSLALQTSGSGFDFDPVLFGRERLDRAEEGATLDEGQDGLLPPALATDFARRFRSGDGSRRTYLLDGGLILYVDPQLRTVLKEVRRAQAAPPEQRRAFAAAPQRYIAEALQAAGEAPAELARLFVETQQYSERVAGIDVWRKPVLPWIKPRPDSWLPERFGIRVGEGADARIIEIMPERLPEAVSAAENAVREERASFLLEGETIPATQSTLDALSSLNALVETARSAPEQAVGEEPPVSRQRYFLQVRDNLEEVAYASLDVSGPLDAAPAQPASFPSTLRSPPKPHQEEGFQWLAGCWQSGMAGALLADDMGLGKTYQTLALLAWLRARGDAGKPVLIVAPTGLLANWRAEIQRHVQPDALGRVVGVYGAELGRLRAGGGRDIDTGASVLDPAAWAHAGIVLTTYETMRDYHLSFARQPFSVILYDEAQKLKNPASQITRAAKTLNARFRLALTGTPVENRLQDLWSIFDVVHPGLLGSSKSFEETYPAEPERLQALKDVLTRPQGARPPVLLRRMKEECLGSLPKKLVQTLPTPMPPRQVAAYDHVVARALAVKGTGQRGRMLEFLAQLRGVSLHPVDPDSAGGEPDYFDQSARLQTTFSILDAVAAKDEKALIFCESLAMQAVLAAEIRNRYKLPHPVARIHGGVSGDARQQAVDAFQSRGDGFDAMILSPKAGGVGLTLTAANHVIHLSRWWNPAVEDQATDRAFRIGQTRDVTVYLPQSVHPDAQLAETSFDLKLHALMERKRELSRGLFGAVEEESDADSLFDAVVTEAAPPAPPVAALVASPPLSPGNSDPAPKRRSLLSLRSRPAKAEAIQPKRPAEAALAMTSPLAPAPDSAHIVPGRIVYEPDMPRDFAIFRQPLEGDPPREIHIVDPYAAAGHRARQNVVAFVDMLVGGGAMPQRVTLTTYDGESIDGPYETSEAQYSQMQALWSRRFGKDVLLGHHQRSKWGARDFHDREVRVETRSGRILIWDLGRGIDGVMNTRHGCRVNFCELAR